jgi:hypothetical protein
MSSGEESSTSRLEKLHELAALGETELEARYRDGLELWLTEFVNKELPETTAPPVGSSKEAVEAIVQLARDRKAWSQRLGSIVIELSDCRTQEAKEQASAKLLDFIQQCPWKQCQRMAAQG